MNKLIVLPAELAEKVKTKIVKPTANYLPKNTFRFNMDKQPHIESVLGDISEYIVDRSSITENAPEEK